jgi:hypothetical protein
MSRQTLVAMYFAAVACVFAGNFPLSAADNEEPREFAKARLEAAKKGYETADGVYMMGVWAARILESELTLCTTADDRIAAFESQIRRARGLEKMVREAKKEYTTADLMEAIFLRNDAEYKLAKEKINKARTPK